MKKLISNKEVLKDAFQAIAYYVFIAGFLKLALPASVNEPIAYKIGLLFIALVLSVLATFYAMFHVGGSITKLYFPEFKTPIIDDAYQAPKVYELFKRKDLPLWIALGLPYYLIGAEIVGYGLKN